MTPAEARSAIQSRFLYRFNGQFPIDLDNQEFKTPRGEDKWTRLSVQFINAQDVTLGQKKNRRFTRGGISFVQVFTPAETATEVNDLLAKEILDLFDGERIGDLWFEECSIRTVGASGKWYSQNVILNFKYEEVK